jgi:hypothetical protein
MDDWPPRPSLYVTVPMPLPPLTAQAAFDRVREHHTVFPGADRWSIDTGSAVLRLIGPGAADPRTCELSPYRVVAGRLADSGRWRRGWAVDVELTPWSTQRTTLGLRPTGRRLMRSAPSVQDRYGATATAALERLATLLVTDVDARLRNDLVDVVAHPSLRRG